MANLSRNENKRHTSTRGRCVVFCYVAFISGTNGFCAQEVAEDTVPLRIAVARDFSTVTVTGLSASEIASVRDPAKENLLHNVLRVNLTDSSRDEQVLGKVELKDDSLLFKPRFPFREGVSYTSTVDTTPISNRTLNVSISFVRPRKIVEPAVVTAVYPSSSELPENLLRFYLHFSEPMQQGNSYQHLRLVDVDLGKPVPYPFLELGEELWDPSGMRLTVLFDPGRVKQGLKPREIAGPVLVAGTRYRLEIAGTWKDVNGNRIEPHSKDFVAIKADTTQPDPMGWKISVPEARTSNPLVIEFPEPLDHAMLQRVIAIKNSACRQIGGTILVERNERLWQFTPSESWKRGSYYIECLTTLEDVVGNSIGRAFEVLPNDEVAQTGEESIKIQFEITETSER